MIYKKPCRYLDLCAYSFARYSEKGFSQIYRALYGDTMLVLFEGTSTLGGRKVRETSIIAFNLPSKRKVITLEFRNIEINICPR